MSGQTRRPRPKRALVGCSSSGSVSAGASVVLLLLLPVNLLLLLLLLTVGRRSELLPVWSAGPLPPLPPRRPGLYDDLSDDTAGAAVVVVVGEDAELPLDTEQRFILDNK